MATPVCVCGESGGAHDHHISLFPTSTFPYETDVYVPREDFMPVSISPSGRSAIIDFCDKNVIFVDLIFGIAQKCKVTSQHYEKYCLISDTKAVLFRAKSVELYEFKGEGVVVRLKKLAFPDEFIRPYGLGINRHSVPSTDGSQVASTIARSGKDDCIFDIVLVDTSNFSATFKRVALPEQLFQPNMRNDRRRDELFRTIQRRTTFVTTDSVVVNMSNLCIIIFNKQTWACDRIIQVDSHDVRTPLTLVNNLLVCGIVVNKNYDYLKLKKINIHTGEITISDESVFNLRAITGIWPNKGFICLVFRQRAFEAVRIPLQRERPSLLLMAHFALLRSGHRVELPTNPPFSPIFGQNPYKATAH